MGDPEGNILICEGKERTGRGCILSVGYEKMKLTRTCILEYRGEGSGVGGRGDRPKRQTCVSILLRKKQATFSRVGGETVF